MSTSPSQYMEEARLQALFEHDILNVEPDSALAHIVELAAYLLGAPTAFISFVDRDRQIFHAKIGLDLCETSRDVAFCAQTIAQDEIFIVLDASCDPRFRDNMLVTGSPFIRFYAGAPLRTFDGYAIGTLCLAGPEPRSAFTDTDKRILEDLARLVLDRLELRRIRAVQNTMQSRFEHIAATSPDAIVCLDACGCLTFWSAAAERLFGYTAAQALSQPIALLIPKRMRGGSEGDLRRIAEGETVSLINRTIELTGQHRDGGEFPIEVSLSSWQENGRVAFGAIMRDVSQRRAVDECLFRLAHLDPLTELPNRCVLRGRIEAVLADKRAIAMLLLDLDGFKEVNDAHGHAVGDIVLRLTADRLRECIREGSLAARLGGDEFAVIMPDIGDPLVAAAQAEILVQALSKPYRLEGHVLSLSVSIGIALSPAHEDREDELRACADAALYRAKADGRGRWCLFTPSLREAAQRQRACRDALRLAVERSEFVLHYQPQVRLSDGALTGAEALIRWQHPEHGLLSPAMFLEVLDNSSDAAQVGDWVLRTACAQAQAWHASAPQPFRIGVNLCAAQFQRGDLVERVRAALNETGLPAHALELEITETIILRHDTEVVTALHELRAMGVGIAFDDYGTGYASLSLLKRFPLTRLKIDRSFVSGLCENDQDAAIVRAVIGLSRSFGLDVIAEGIETIEQQQRLLGKGCLEGQGYLFGRPVSAQAFAARFKLSHEHNAIGDHWADARGSDGGSSGSFAAHGDLLNVRPAKQVA